MKPRLNFFRFRNDGAGVAVLELGAAHVACGVWTMTRDGRCRVMRHAEERFDPEATTTGKWPEEIARAIGAAAERTGVRGDVRLVLPAHLVFAKAVRTPAIAVSKRAKVARFEAAQNIPYPLEEVVWDYAVLAEDGASLELMLVAARADALAEVCAAVSSAGLSVSRIVPPHVALHRGFRLMEPHATDCVLLVEVGARSTQLLWVKGERCFGRTLPWAGNSVTRAIADELNVSFAEAEQLKLQVGATEGVANVDGASWATVNRAVEAFGGRLGAEIVRTMLDLERRTERWRPARVLLTGGGAHREILCATLAEKLGLPVEGIETGRRFGVFAADDVTGGPNINGNIMTMAGAAVAAGGAMAGRELDLLPAAHKERREFQRRQPRFLAAGVLLAFFLLLAIRHFDRAADEAEGQWLTREAELRPLRARAMAMAETLTELEGVREEVQALRRLGDAKSSWSRLLAGLQEELESIEDVWLDRLTLIDGNVARNDEVSPEVRLAVSGRLLDRELTGAVAPTHERAAQLLVALARSRFVAELRDERFEAVQPGVLRFDCTLVIRGGEML